MEFQLATLWEGLVDEGPDFECLVAGEVRHTRRTLDERANRLAHHLRAGGIDAGDLVGVYSYNRAEHVEALFACWKISAVPVNVNYRYVADELRYVWADAGLKAMIAERSFVPLLNELAPEFPDTTTYVLLEDGSDREPEFKAVEYEAALGAASPEGGFGVERSPDDLYVVYTGGTTGMPKGVMYRQRDFVQGLYDAFAMLGLPVATPSSTEEIPAFVDAMAQRPRFVSVPCPPLMHGTGMWVGGMPPLLSGGTAVLLESRSFDAHELWRTVERERVTRITIVGDAFARPMLRALEELEDQSRHLDLTSVDTIVSSGAMWSAEIKDGLTSRLDAFLIDALGSTEGGGYAVTAAARGLHVETAKFQLAPTTRVLTPDDRDVEAGSGEPGLLASASAAYGYYKDEEKTAGTFRQIDGTSYVLTGDWATVEADGTITLLGRGSNCINSGGEKIYPEEVEEALKRHEAVDDCLVVGVPHERLGQQIVAVAGSTAADHPDGDELRAWLRSSLSGYKIPKSIVVVDQVRRAPNGKADYGWAKEVATSVAEPT